MRTLMGREQRTSWTQGTRGIGARNSSENRPLEAFACAMTRPIRLHGTVPRLRFSHSVAECGSEIAFNACSARWQKVARSVI